MAHREVLKKRDEGVVSVLLVFLVTACAGSSLPADRGQAEQPVGKVQVASVQIGEAEYPDYVAKSVLQIEQHVDGMGVLIQLLRTQPLAQMNAVWRAQLLSTAEKADQITLAIISTAAPDRYDSYHATLVEDYLITHGLLYLMRTQLESNDEQAMNDVYRLYERLQQTKKPEVCPVS